MEKYTGKIVHIDFGDCFEVTKVREKFPEKIPFRLTRMLINALEVSGIEGTFRLTCESVMNVLRENKDSLMAMLEAFVHDPLLSWKIVGDKTGNEDEDKSKLDDSFEYINNRALEVIERISNKLTGRDFDINNQLGVEEQVNNLINQATSNVNLSQCYVVYFIFNFLRDGVLFGNCKN
jgi:serine/threonine-protein kinase mTOR